jgi:hypothetical protein
VTVKLVDWVDEEGAHFERGLFGPRRLRVRLWWRRTGGAGG